MSIDQHNPKPFYKQVGEDIINQINSGALKVGDKLQTQNELVKHYDVSLITIKRALSDLISEGILYARAGKGTFVAKQPQKIDLSKHLTVAYVLKDLNNPFYQSMVSSMERYLSKNNCNLMLYSSDNHMANEERKIRYFMDMGVSGLILGSMFHSHYTNTMIQQLDEQRFPYVMVSYTEDDHIPFVGADQEAGGYMAAQHLLEAGYSRVGIVTGEEGNLVGEARKKGFVRALEEQDVPLDLEHQFQIKVGAKRDDHKSGYEVGQAFCKLKNPPQAMFIYNDLSALGFMEAISESKLSVPKDVAIIGFDDIPMGRASSVPLTTIHQPTDKIAKLAVENLIGRINGQPSVTRKLIKPKLVVRKSCCNN